MMLPRRTILGVALTAATASAARAQLTIDMTKPSFEPVPIAIVDFQGDAVGGQMASVITKWADNTATNAYGLYLTKQGGIIKVMGMIGVSGVTDAGFPGHSPSLHIGIGDPGPRVDRP